MDRPIVYPGAIPLDTDLLNTNRNIMKALGMLAQAVLGTSPVVSGLTVGPNSPAAMNVLVGPGSITALATVDATAYGSLAADTSDALVKMGVNLATTTLAITAPGTSGYSQNYLIEAAFLEADGTPVVLPYYNAANPSAPYLGPGNSGTAQNTLRAQTVQLQAKAGVPATTGTQTTPAVDAGWVGLAVVTVAYGAASITAGNISAYTGAPIIPYSLPQLAPGFSNQVAITSSRAWTVPNGVARIKVTVTGAGGGGGGSTTSYGAGSGGAGGTAIGVYAVTPGTSYTVTVGTGGAAGAAAGGTGGAGTASSFGVLASANGGGGGNGGVGLGGANGAGGTASGGTINLPGGDGMDSSGILSTTGGASYWGGGNSGGGGGVSPGPATCPGSGGGGGQGTTATVGNAGAPGFVLVEY